MLKIENLHVKIKDSDKKILNGVSITINENEITALMGPNGSGKSTLSYVIAGHPAYEILEGKIYFKGVDITEFEPQERSLAGIFLAFQNPIEIPGLTVGKFLKRIKEIHTKTKIEIKDFLSEVRENMNLLQIDKSFINRYLNDGFSGGEKKRMEILQLLTINPQFAILDETDSGLDIDAMKLVFTALNKLKNKNFSSLIITHYPNILNYIEPDKVYVISEGKIIKEGGREIINKIEMEGYKWIQ